MSYETFRFSHLQCARKNHVVFLSICLLLILTRSALPAQSRFSETESFDSGTSRFVSTGRGYVIPDNGAIVTKDAYARFGKKDWKNYRVCFNARTRADEQQVQIWAAFEAYNRDVLA
jgi:hypothetical protein